MLWLWPIFHLPVFLANFVTTKVQGENIGVGVPVFKAMSVAKPPPDEFPATPNSPERGGPPPAKKKKLGIEPQRIGPVSTLEEIDISVLQFQKKKMKQRIEARQKLEDELRLRIEQLETRQTQDDVVLNVINKHWNQLNEDIRVLLRRFDRETSIESESKNESEETTSFITQLSTWDTEEMDTKLVNRVQVSTRAVAKIFQAFDRLQQRSAKITKSLKENVAEILDELPDADESLKIAYIKLETENRRLQARNINLHEGYHPISLKIKQLTDGLTIEITRKDELKNRVDDLTYEVSKFINRNDKLVEIIQDLAVKYRELQEKNGGESEKKECDFKEDMTDIEVVNLQRENQVLKELVNQRLAELEALHQNQNETLVELENLKQDIRHLPDTLVADTTEYKCLQSKFSVMYHDCGNLKTKFDENRASSLLMRQHQVKHNESMEGEEFQIKKKLRAEMVQLEDNLGQVRKEYEMLRIEFEQNLAANEQTGPINREMRHLITSLQAHNQQLKGDSQRYRKRYKELAMEMMKLKTDRDVTKIKIGILNERGNLRRRFLRQSSESECSSEDEDFPVPSSSKQESLSSPDVKMNHDGESSNDGVENMKNDKLNNDMTMKKEVKQEKKAVKVECDNLKDLRAQLKKALNEQRETKLLLDMYKGTSKDQRERVQLMASEKKNRLEIEELKLTVKRYQDYKKDAKRKVADDDVMRKLNFLEGQVDSLQKQVMAKRMEEETLITEMEVTGQAFEDMQEANSRLIQQLREKDDANFKLMSDRIKANQMQKFEREQRDLLQDQITTMSKQLEAQSLVIRKLEEKERYLLNSIAAMEKEGVLRTQASESYKRKFIESAQSSADIRLHLDKYQSQMKDTLLAVTEKTWALEAEAYKSRRLKEELVNLKGKLETLSKVEFVANADEVMVEELRSLKESLTCPSCKVKRKDAVLAKCFHVFCFDCLRTRYEMRQRKCPKCNAAFGANDYHRLYLT